MAATICCALKQSVHVDKRGLFRQGAIKLSCQTKATTNFQLSVIEIIFMNDCGPTDHDSLITEYTPQI